MFGRKGESAMRKRREEITEGSEDENRLHQYIKQLNAAYLKKRLIVFYGAGLSMQLNLPGWKELIQHVVEEVIANPQQRKACIEEIDRVNFWEAMEHVKSVAKVGEDKIRSLIANYIRDKQNNNEEILSAMDHNYKDLKDSDISFFITTNYDTFLNKVDPRCESYDIDVLKDQANADLFGPDEKRKKVLYLHGHINKESSIIITKEAVEGIYRNERWISVFHGLLNNYHILFIGISLADEYLRNFLTQNAKNTNNSYFVITDEKVEIDCKKIAIPKENEKKVGEIRKILNRIKERPRETVWIRVGVEAANQKAFRECVEKCLEKTEGREVRYIYNSHKNSMIIAAIHMEKSTVIEEAFKKYKDILKRSKKYILNDAGTVYFYSCNEENFHERDFDATFKKDMEGMMQRQMKEGSKGYIVDRAGLEFKDRDEKMFGKFQTVQYNIESNKNGGVMLQKSYNFYVDEGIAIKGAEIYGMEVHVSGFCFFNDKVLMEKRKQNTAIASGMIAPVGGRMRTGEDFEGALARHYRDDCNLLIDNVEICNTFKTFNANIPGLAFVCTSNGTCRKNEKMNKELAENYQLYTKEELLELHREGKLACTEQLLLEAFDKKEKIRKKTIKLRIVLWSNCCYKCRGCHHENLSNTAIVYDHKAVLESLKRLEQLFDVRQITVTGGEPMQSIPQLENLLEGIAQYFPMTDVAVITNGERLDREVAKKLDKYHIRYKISLYGYDNDSFEAYTGCRNYKRETYLEAFQKKLKVLNEENIRFTVNIPVHKYIAPGLRGLLDDDRMQELLLEKDSKVKVIDMVKPRGEDGGVFEDIYVPLEDAKRDLTTGETGGGSRHYEELKNNINYFVYPCKSCNGYNEDCFENFALTLEPDGNLLVCKNAVEKLCFDGQGFVDLLKEKGVNVEFAEYNKEYGECFRTQ